MFNPQKYSDIFEINPLPTANIKNIFGFDVVIIDGVYNDISKVETLARAIPANIWKDIPGGKNWIEYYDCRLELLTRFGLEKFWEMMSKIVDSIYGFKTEFNNLFLVNYFKWIIKKEETVIGNMPHQDIGMSDFTVVTFLNNDSEVRGGIGFYQMHNNNINLDGKEEQSYYFDDVFKHWTVPEVVSAKSNRAVIFPSEMWHGAFHSQYDFRDNVRLTQSMFLQKA